MASAADVDAAKPAIGMGGSIADRAFIANAHEEPKSLLEKIFVFAIVGLFFIGAVLARAAPQIWLNIVGFFLVGVALLGIWIFDGSRKAEKSHV